MNTHKNKKIIIVSAYSSGAKLAALFNKKNYQCFHVTTRREWQIARLRAYFCESDFIENLIIENDDSKQLIELVNYLKKFAIELILPGCESGVSLADTLSQYFDVPKNDYALTSARRNKYYMIEAIKNQGLLHANQFKSDDLYGILNWFHHSFHKKIVLKPLSSSSSDSVFYCHNETEIRHAFNAIFGSKDMYDEINQEVLAQEFIEGDEYIVNTVSRNGLHCVVDIWKGVSHNKTIVSNDSYADLIHPDLLEYKILSSYVKQVLVALGINNGAAHSEIKITKDGACLIETGARLAGKVDFVALENIFGFSQLSLLVDGMLDFKSFERHLKLQSMPNKHARYVYFAADKEGWIKREPDISEMLRIENLSSVTFLPKKGEKLTKTSKTLRSPRPGYAYLIAETREIIEKQYRILRQAESNLYESITQN